MVLEVGMAGCVEYGRALAWQEALVARRLAGGPDALLLLEHPPVYTLGRGADPRYLGRAAGGAVPVWRVSRGGEVTWHGPGQLVGYPVLGLMALRRDVHWYLRRLEDVLIAALADVGVAAGRVPGRTGVWVAGRRKIASIGVAVRRWVTWHGFALNVSPDLRSFDAITPCGLAGVEMTSVAREGGLDDVAGVALRVRERLVAIFGYTGWRPLASGAPTEARL
jgi:lipoyl(octanoyl) transferase